MLRKLSIYILLSLTTLPGCFSADENLVKGSNHLEKKTVSAALGAADSKVTPANNPVIARATYLIDVSTASGAKPCAGEVSLSIHNDFTIELPTAKVQCLSLTIDLGALLGAQIQNGPPLDISSLQSDHGSLTLSKIAGAEFNPPRPFILGPLIQDVSQYQGLTRNTQVTVTVPAPSSGPPLSDQGTFVTKVLEIGGSYQNKFLPSPFTQVMHWTLETQGFSTIPAKYGLLFKKWEWYWNIRPIMIPKIIITLDNIAGFIDSSSGGDLSALIGEVTVTLTVKQFDLNGG